MKKGTIRSIVLTVVFILALFVTSYFTNHGDSDLTADMSKATLPTISFTVNGQEINSLVGHVNEMDFGAVRNTVVPLEKDGKIEVNIQKYEQEISSFHYEIFSIDGAEKLVEKTEESVEQTYSIQAGKYLEGKKEARLKIRLDLGESRSVYFYTRLADASGAHAAECMDYVKLMHTNMIENKETSSIEKVLESGSQGDNTTLQHVTIYSDLRHVTWGGLKPKVIHDVHWSVQEVKEAYTSVRLDYQVGVTGEDDQEEFYQVKEFFRVRYLDGKYYLLTYDRTLEELFDGTKDVLTSKGIDLGFTAQDVQYKVNEDGTILSFVQANELWSYNQKKEEFALVFSFSDAEKEDIRHRHDEHSVKILSMEENGNLTFAVYGYMNRGNHEGESGAAIYYFNLAKNAVEEKAFIPSDQSFAAIEKDLGKFAFYHDKNNVLYAMTSGELCEIDLKTGERSVLLSGLKSGQYVSSDDGCLIAYQKEDQGTEVAVLNFVTDQTQTVSAAQGEVIQPLGFVKGDFVYGVSRAQDAGQLSSGEHVLGMYKLEIRNAKNEVVKTYQMNDHYLLGINIKGNMITLKRADLENGTYKEIAEDYITNNEEKANTVSLQSYRTERKETQFRFVFENGMKSTKAKVWKAKQVLFDRDTTITFGKEPGGARYSVFGLGKIVGVYEDAGEAVKVAGETSGVVISPKQRYVWEDGNRVSWYRNFKIGAFRANGGESTLAACVRAVLAYEGKTADVVSELASKTLPEVLNAYCEGEAVRFKGCSAADMRYLLDKGTPVIALTGGDSAIVLVGYDAKTLTYIDPGDGGIRTKSFSAVDTMISGSGNTFFGYVK